MPFMVAVCTILANVDVGLQAGTYWNKQADDLSYMLGAEVGYGQWPTFGCRGYNFMGFEDEDIAYDDSTQEGHLDCA